MYELAAEAEGTHLKLRERELHHLTSDRFDHLTTLSGLQF